MRYFDQLDAALMAAGGVWYGSAEALGKDTMEPRGVVLHHTASRPSAMTPVPSLGTVINGRPGIPGPLCNFLIGRDGSVVGIAAGTSNDTGRTMNLRWSMMEAGIAPTTDAPEAGEGAHNNWAYDIEVENDGVGEPYSDVVIASLVRLTAALCRQFGWNENHVFHHREMTGRKIDMSYRGDIRGAVARALDIPDVPTDQEQDMGATYQAKGTATIYYRDTDGVMTPFTDYQSFLDTNNDGVPGPVITDQNTINRLVAKSDRILAN